MFSNKRVNRVVSFGLNGLLFMGLLVLGACKPATETEVSIEQLIQTEEVVRTQKTNRLIKTAEFPDPATLDVVEREESVPTEGEKISFIDESDLKWLATAIYFESRSEPIDGQFKVAQVILKRTEDTRWPNTIKDVVSQGEELRNRCQFSFMCDGIAEHIEDKQSWKTALKVAAKALKEWHRGDKSCAIAYHANYVTSKRALNWFAKLDKEQAVGTHIFYCDRARVS